MKGILPQGRPAKHSIRFGVKLFVLISLFSLGLISTPVFSSSRLENIMDNAVNTTGYTEAQGFAQEKGVVILRSAEAEKVAQAKASAMAKRKNQDNIIAEAKIKNIDVKRFTTHQFLFKNTENTEIFSPINVCIKLNTYFLSTELIAHI